MILYHGTTVDIKEIDLQKSKPNKDFGKGFYLSAEKEQAIAMADYKAEQIDGVPVVNAFEFDEACLHDSSLKVKAFSEYDNVGRILYLLTATILHQQTFTTMIL